MIQAALTRLVYRLEPILVQRSPEIGRVDLGDRPLAEGG